MTGAIMMKKVKNKLEKMKEKNQRLISIVCIDNPKDFSLDYYFDKAGKISVVSFTVPKSKPVLESIMDIFPNADYYEREIHDFFGIEFEGNPKLHLKLFMADDWKKKPPLLKDWKQVKK